MTKKDYQALAGALYRSRVGSCSCGEDCPDHTSQAEQWNASRDAIADVLAADNPRFNRECFMTACETGDVTRRPKRKRAMVTELIPGVVF